MTDTKAVFISGGGTGLGRATAELLQQQGWRVGVAGRRAVKLDELVADLKGKATAYVLDVADADAVSKAIEDFAPTAIVNAAAILGQGNIYEDLSPARFAEIQAINVNGSFNCCSAAMCLWNRNKQAGDIVNITSLAGIRGMQAFPGFSAYAASKHAVVGLTEALAKDGKEHDVRVNAIAPGLMRTDMVGALGMEPLTLPSEVAPTVAFLLNRNLSGPITGTTVEIHCND